MHAFDMSILEVKGRYWQSLVFRYDLSRLKPADPLLFFMRLAHILLLRAAGDTTLNRIRRTIRGSCPLRLAT